MTIEPAAPTPLEKNQNMIANATDQPKFPRTRSHTLLAHRRRELSVRLVLDRAGTRAAGAVTARGFGAVGIR